MPKMTKLAEWLTGLTVFFGIYAALVTKQIKHHFVDDYFFEIQIFPLICIVLLGVSVISSATFLLLLIILVFMQTSALRRRHSTLQNIHIQRLYGSRRGTTKGDKRGSG